MYDRRGTAPPAPPAAHLADSDAAAAGLTRLAELLACNDPEAQVYVGGTSGGPDRIREAAVCAAAGAPPRAASALVDDEPAARRVAVGLGLEIEQVGRFWRAFGTFGATNVAVIPGKVWA